MRLRILSNDYYPHSRNQHFTSIMAYHQEWLAQADGSQARLLPAITIE